MSRAARIGPLVAIALASAIAQADVLPGPPRPPPPREQAVRQAGHSCPDPTRRRDPTAAERQADPVLFAAGEIVECGNGARYHVAPPPQPASALHGALLQILPPQPPQVTPLQ